jgi:hypothetical protein
LRSTLALIVPAASNEILRVPPDELARDAGLEESAASPLGDSATVSSPPGLTRISKTSNVDACRDAGAQPLSDRERGSHATLATGNLVDARSTMPPSRLDAEGATMRDGEVEAIAFGVEDVR